MNNRKDRKTRQPIVEGIFYPSEKDELISRIKTYSRGFERQDASVILTPHGGYDIIGTLLASAFMSAADREIEEVVILSPVHREEQDKIILPSFSRFATSAGDLEINMKSLHIFKGQDKSIIRDDIPHMEEHAIEDQLPFISHFFPEATILPILLGKTNISLVKKLTSALKRAYENRFDKVLFIATGNLSSYDKKEIVLERADKALDLYEKGNWREICEEKRTGRIDACGSGVLAALLALFPNNLNMRVLGRNEPVGKESEKGKTVAYGALSFKEVPSGTS